MATETLRPNGAGTHTECDVSGAAQNYQAVDEEVADEGSSYVYNGDEGGDFTDTYNLVDSAVGAGTITNVRIYVRCKIEEP